MQRLVWVLTSTLWVAASLHGDDFDSLRLAAIERATAKVASSVLRIETAGGLDRVGQAIKESGPTTAVVVGADGWLITSSFNLGHRPAGVLVVFPDGRRLPAKVVSQDKKRMLTLLKIDASGLPVAVPIPRSEMAQGQTAISLGRSWSLQLPSITTGIISAVDRVDGNAVQTDAKVSPVNYGGPLLDLSGRVYGVIAPFSPEASDVESGVEWYDSGIGFAVVLEDILAELPKLKTGDILPGRLGVVYDAKNPYAENPPVHRVAWRSPAEAAGLRKGVQIVSVNDNPVRYASDLKRLLGRFNAGDAVTLTWKTDGNRTVIEKSATLVDKMPVYQRPYLGLLTESGQAGPAETRIRAVYKDSPTDKANLQVGDEITEIGGQKIASRQEMETAFDRFAPGETIPLKLRRGNATIDAKAVATAFPTTLPVDVPNSPAGVAKLIDDKTAKGRSFWSIRPQAVECPTGVVLWFWSKEAPQKDAVVAAWKSACEKHNLILAGVDPERKGTWGPDDLEHAEAIVDRLRKERSIDPARVVIVAMGSGIPVANSFLNAHRDRVRGFIVQGTLPGRFAASDPAEKLAFLARWNAADKSAAAAAETAFDERRKEGYPVVGHECDDPLSATAVEEAARWIDWIGGF